MYFLHQHYPSNSSFSRKIVHASDLYETLLECHAVRDRLIEEYPLANLEVRELLQEKDSFCLVRAADLSYVAILPSQVSLGYTLDDIQVAAMTKHWEDTMYKNTYLRLSCFVSRRYQYITFEVCTLFSQDEVDETVDEIRVRQEDMIRYLNHITSPKDWH